MELLEAAYAAGVRWHRRAYDAGLLRRARLAVPTISVGNVTWGGTGKTPMTEYVARHALARGVAPVVLLRDYGRDEVHQHRSRLAGTPALVAPGADRVAAAAAALAELRARDPRPRAAAILDDGLQHWRLERDLDVVMVSCLDPFGGGRLIPRGPLREPAAEGLARAQVVVLHHADLVGRPAADALAARIAAWNPRAHVARTRFQASALLPLAGPPPPASLSGLRVWALAAVGCPEAFVRTAERAGASLAGRSLFRDHYAFSADELRTAAEQAAASGADVLLTTEKDAARCREQLRTIGPKLPFAALSGRLAVDEGEAGLCEALDRVLERAGTEY